MAWRNVQSDFFLLLVTNRPELPYLLADFSDLILFRKLIVGYFGISLSKFTLCFTEEITVKRCSQSQRQKQGNCVRSTICIDCFDFLRLTT